MGILHRLAGLMLLASVAGCRTTLNWVPHYGAGQIPPVRAGFYTVHVPPGGSGGAPFGEVLYLYPGSYVETSLGGTALRTFAGIRGVFHPNGMIESRLQGGRVDHRWFHEDRPEGGSLWFDLGKTPEGVLRLQFSQDGDREARSLELRYRGPRLAREAIPTAYIAHRGTCYFGLLGYNTEGIYPANTVPSFRSALESGYDGFELDLRVTRDGKFAVSHDEDLGAATTLSGRICDKTLDELREACVIGSTVVPEMGLTVVRPYLCAPLPGLKEVVEEFLPDERLRHIVLDIKPDTDDRLFLATQDALGGIRDRTLLSKLVFVAHSGSALTRLRELSPSSRFVLEGDTGTEPFDDPDAWLPLARQDHDGVSLNFGLYLAPPTTHAGAARSLLETARARGYATLAFTVNDAWTLDLLSDAGLHADFLLTDVPYHRLARRQLRAHHKSLDSGK